MGDPWEVLERYSDPELIELSRKLGAELIEEELKAVDCEIDYHENLRIKSFVVLPILSIIGLALNLGAILIPFEFPQYPAFALTHTTAVLCWDIAVIKLFRLSLRKHFIKFLNAVAEVKKPVLSTYHVRNILLLPSLGFFWLVFSFLKPQYLLYKNTIGALADIITLHIEIFTPFIVYLTLKLVKTPVIIPYGSKLIKRQYRTVKELWEVAKDYKPLTEIRLLFIALSIVVINTFLLILLARLLGIRHTPHDVEVFSRIAPIVTLGATPILTITLRNLLSKLPLREQIDSILGIVGIMITIVFCLPIISCVIVYYRLV